MAANYAPATAAPPAASSPFSWVPRQMLSGDAAEEEGDSDDSDRGDEDRGEGDEAELVIDIPNEWSQIFMCVWVKDRAWLNVFFFVFKCQFSERQPGSPQWTIPVSL